jgi:hypothetical protein
MQKAAIGFRVHSGWAAMVAISMNNGSPEILERRKLLLVKTFSYTYRQPYHTAAKMALADASQFVKGVEKESYELGADGIRNLQRELKPLGYKLVGGALLLASGRELPEFERILASHALIHTADGELFRESIRRACGRAKLPLTAIKERDLLMEAGKRLRKRPEFLARCVDRIGKSLGPPWTQDEKLAALGAWFVLAS